MEGYKTSNDPLTNMEAVLIEEKICTAVQLDQIADRVKDIIKECAEFAQTSPEPEASELYTDILTGN